MADHRQRAERLTVMAVGEGDEARFAGLAGVLPEVEAHLHGHFDCGRAAVGKEAAGQARRRQRGEFRGQLRRRLVSEAREHHVRQLLELPGYGRIDVRMGVTPEVYPPGADRVDVTLTVIVFQPHAVTAANRDQRHGSLVILHLGAGVPDVLEVERAQGWVAVWRHAPILA